MHTPRAFLFSAAAWFMLLLPGISFADNPLGRSSGSSVRIVSINPPLTQALRPGEQLQITAVVEYVLANDKGNLGVFVQADDGHSLRRSCQIPAISQGTGKVTVSADIEVSNTEEVQFIVALYHSDSTSSSVTASRTYHVEEPPAR